MKKLADLYARGKPFLIAELDEETGAPVDEPVAVYLAKINPVQQEEAVRIGNARQAVILTAQQDHSSQQWMAISGRALMKEVGGLVDRLVDEHRAKREPVCESRIAHEDEWKKDGYLQGLRDAWAGGLEAKFAVDPSDPDAARVSAELDRFQAQVDEELLSEVNPFRRDLEQSTIDDLREQWSEAELKLRGLIAFNVEYFKACLAFSVREPCDACPAAAASGEKHVGGHPNRYFSSPDEIDVLDLRVRSQLQAAYNELTVGPTEGKDSPPQAASSGSSAPVAPVETEDSSGQTDVAA